MHKPYDPAIPLLDIHPSEMKTYFHMKMCTCMFIATVVIIIKTLKQSQCPSLGEWVNKSYFRILQYFAGEKHYDQLVSWGGTIGGKWSYVFFYLLRFQIKWGFYATTNIRKCASCSLTLVLAMLCMCEFPVPKHIGIEYEM